MSTNQWLVIAVLAVCVLLVCSVFLVVLDVFGFRAPSAEAVRVDTPTPTPQPSFTRRSSLTFTPTLTLASTATPTRQSSATLTRSTGTPGKATSVAPGKTTPTPASKISATPTRPISRTATAKPGSMASPTATPAQTNSEVRFVSVSVVRPGGNAQVVVQTSPNALCSLMYVSTAGSFVNIPGANQKADGSGNVAWGWKIPSEARPGRGVVIVTCGNATAESPITIER
ncbi:MAG: hypothetical protein HY868_06510 [Chloroflexi bacterium]|nr:hypothetical protein [Chloroflexota bacterium]